MLLFIDLVIVWRAKRKGSSDWVQNVYSKMATLMYNEVTSFFKEKYIEFGFLVGGPIQIENHKLTWRKCSGQGVTQKNC